MSNQFAELSVSLHHLFLATPTTGEGAEHASSAIDWLLVGSLFTNFILLFTFLIWKGAPAVADSLKKRRVQMAHDLEEAQAKQTEAETRLGQYQEKLDNLQREIDQVITSYEVEAGRDCERFESETQKAIARIERETEITIAQETRKAEAAIRAAAIEATIRLVEEKMKQQIKPTDHERLTQQYIESLGRSS
ncbi:MAG: ATP synthase F0 subunit B [Myxococcales bacterium]|nr:ATP synthase F0 subunit B [Myxococcales bacterium]